ncbi:hypothetical protein HMPREF9413_4392 [Paenibacillus sp. HGF7]|nr:hypothetical protein HMPREF9413_4392 [Paenibacillus sp. HGF7]
MHEHVRSLLQGIQFRFSVSSLKEKSDFIYLNVLKELFKIIE